MENSNNSGKNTDQNAKKAEEEDDPEKLFGKSKSNEEEPIEAAADKVNDLFGAESRSESKSDLKAVEETEKAENKSRGTFYGVRTPPEEKFVWNSHLLNKVAEEELHSDWIVHLIHGFVGQSSILFCINHLCN